MAKTSLSEAVIGFQTQGVKLAQKVRIELVSDISGKTLGPNEGSTIRFGLDGKELEIDLSTAEEKEMRSALEQYVAGARRASTPRAGRPSTPGRNQEASQVREWAKANGYEVSARGRVNSEIVDAYRKANG